LRSFPSRKYFYAVGVGKHFNFFQLGAGLNAAGIAAGIRFGQRERADLAGGDEAQKQFMSFGAAVQLGNDGFGARGLSVSAWRGTVATRS